MTSSTIARSVLPCALAFAALACRGSTMRSERVSSDEITLVPPADASITAPRAPRVVRASQLPPASADGAPITVCGTLTRVPIGSVGGPPQMYLWGVSLLDDARPSVLLGPVPPWPGASEGVAPPSVSSSDASLPSVCVRGAWQHEYPLAPGDPPHASRFSGQWLFGVAFE